MAHPLPVSRRFALHALPALLLAPALAGGIRPAWAQYAPREQTRLDISLAAQDDVNPDGAGRPAPILVRVYELKSEQVFENADYFSLHHNDKAVLGTDLLARDEFVLRPGDRRAIRRKSHPEVVAIGVLAGYRDLPLSDWRAVRRLQEAPEVSWYRALWPSPRARLQVSLQAHGVRLVAED